MATKTKKPTGLTITRDGLSFVCGWKVASANHDAGQQFQWKTNLSKNWNSVSIGKAVTSKKQALTASNYYPLASKKLTTFYFRVRGKRAKTTDSKTKKTTKYDWSAWETASFKIQPPQAPTITCALSSTLENVSTFSWQTTVATNDHQPFTRTEYQTLLVRASNVTDGAQLEWSASALGWASGTSSASSSLTREEDTVLLAADSYTRWVRVRAVGPGGASAWAYSRHVYATPYKGDVTSGSVEGVSGGVTAIKTTWAVKNDAAHPIDSIQVQYLIATPEAGRTAPSGANWTAGPTVGAGSGASEARFSISETVGTDKCLWVRVVATHDRKTSYSDPRLVSSGELSEPEDLTVSADSSTYRATVSASNTSAVPDSLLAVVFRKEGQADYVCGIITGADPITVQCARWADGSKVSFGVYAFQGSYRSSSRADGTTQYAVTANMRSTTIWSGGIVPSAPTNVVGTISAVGEVMLTWAWAWNDANRAEVSWSQNPNAWESTAEPQSYLIENIHAAKIRVSNLDIGVTWYFRVRLAKASGDNLVYGPYSDIVAVNLSSAPLRPILALSAAVVTQDQSITASWSYDSTDGTAQSYAEVWRVSVNGSVMTPISRVLSTTTAKHATIPAGLWETGTTTYLSVRVTSDSGLQSDWSSPVSVSVASPPSCVIASTSLASVEIEDDDGSTRTVTALTSMPLTVTVTGSGAGGVTSLILERAEAYQMERPDGSVFNGFEGEPIAVFTQTGEAEIIITNDDLLGMLDDGAPYRIIATTQDGLGQSATASQDLVVLWSHQAIMPEATAEMDPDNLVAFITPSAPTGAETGDVVDIYRLSADRPELIVQGGSWGTKYVDPYPAIGEFGGHRVVCRTANGDYITADNHPAWIDLGDEDGDALPLQDAIIDFDGERVRLPYDLSLSSSWKKDFTETHYLGGSIQGDWNPGVSRSGSIGTVAVVLQDQDTIQALRRLATYAGVCHVRTPEGSSFAADVQVSESRDAGRGGILASFTLSFTRVDPEGLDGLTYAEWIAGDEEET